MNKIVISKLISIASELDAMGIHHDADRLTDLASSYSAPSKNEIDERMDKSFEDSDDYNALQAILEEMLNSGELTPAQKTEIENIVQDDSNVSDFSNDEDEKKSPNVKELYNPIDSDDNLSNETVQEVQNTDTEKPSEEDLESLFADDPELLKWWRNLGSNNE